MAGLLVASVPTIGLRPADALTPPPQPDERCLGFVQLADLADRTAAATTASEVLGSIRKTAQRFDRVAADAPEAITDDMEVLAASYSDLWKAIRPLGKRMRAVDDADSAGVALTKIAAAVERWWAEQDAEGLSGAQGAVDDWLASACGFRLGVEPSEAG